MIPRDKNMKILPSDDLSNNPDYNKNYKKYFPHIHGNTVTWKHNTVKAQSKPGLLSRVKQLLGLKSGNN